jgi:ATP-dependent exoDNAse (exonuclease V) beta subunit
VQVRYSCLSPGTVEELLPAGERVPHALEAEPSRGEQQPELGLAALPAPRALAVSRLSYSSLQDYARCSYRFYLQRALKLPPVEPPPAAQAAPEAGFSARLRGSLVHLLLEELDFGRPLAPSEEEVNELLEAHGESPTPEAVADLRGMVERFAGSALRERISRARRVRTELPFAFTLTPPGAGGRSLLLNGVVDVHATEEEGLLVVDYKSDALLGRDPAAVTEEGYGTQRLVYALAGLRSGAPRVEVVHSFLELPEAPVSASFDAADAGRLEAELLELARGVVENRFTPTEDPHVDLCADCPGRPALCSWGHDMTLRPPGSRGLSVGTRT